MELIDIFPGGVVGIIDEYKREFEGVPRAEFKVLEGEAIQKVITLSDNTLLIFLSKGGKYTEVIWEISKGKITKIKTDDEKTNEEILITDIMIYAKSDIMVSDKLLVINPQNQELLIYNTENEFHLEKRLQFDTEKILSLEKLNEEKFLAILSSYDSVEFKLYSSDGELGGEWALETENFPKFFVVDSNTIIIYTDIDGADSEDSDYDYEYYEPDTKSIFLVFDISEGKVVNTLTIKSRAPVVENIISINSEYVAIPITQNTYIWKITEPSYSHSLNGMIIQSLDNFFILKISHRKTVYKVYVFDPILAEPMAILEVDGSIPTLIHDNKLLLKYENSVEIYDLLRGGVVKQFSIDNFSSRLKTQLKLLPNGDVYDKGKNKIVVYK